MTTNKSTQRLMDDSTNLQLPTPLQLRNDLPITEPQRSFIAKSRDTIKQILNGTDNRIALVVGPCSIHDSTAAIDYAHSLLELSKHVADTFFLIMRFYTEKSRTSLGWKGLLYDPDLDGSHNIPEGLRQTRSLLLQLASLGVPAAAELLDPFSVPYYNDLLSWGCIGARTSESQPHRLIASDALLPIGFKNNTSGRINAAINGILVASHPHTFIGIKDDGKVGVIRTEGNPNTHIVLRGGDNAPNYEPASIRQTLDALEGAQLPLRIMIDCSHDNSRRNHKNQAVVFNSALEQIALGNTFIRGLVLESHLNAGNQPLGSHPLRYAVSITDPCLDWEATAELIQQGRCLLAESKRVACALKGICS